MKTYIGHREFEWLESLNEYIVRGNVVFDSQQHIHTNKSDLLGNKFADISLGKIIPKGLRRSYMGTYGFAVIHPTIEISARVPCFSEEESKLVLRHIKRVAGEKGLSLRVDAFSRGFSNPVIYEYKEIV